MVPSLHKLLRSPTTEPSQVNPSTVVDRCHRQEVPYSYKLLRSTKTKPSQVDPSSQNARPGAKTHICTTNSSLKKRRVVNSGRDAWPIREALRSRDSTCTLLTTEGFVFCARQACACSALGREHSFPKKSPGRFSHKTFCQLQRTSPSPLIAASPP